MSEELNENDECNSIGLGGLTEKIKAVSELVERRKEQVRRRDSLLREAVRSLLQPVSAEPEPGGSTGTVPLPASRLLGLRARPAWQRVCAARWLVATDLINDTSSEVPYPCLLLSVSPHQPLVYESRLVRLPFNLDDHKGKEAGHGGLPPGQVVRTIAIVDVPTAAGATGCRLSLTLASPPGLQNQQLLDNDVGFYQLPAGDVTLSADDLLSKRKALFTGTDVSSEDLQAVWALAGQPLRLRLQPPQPLSLQACHDRLLQAGFVPAASAVTLTDPGHPLFGCLLLLADADTAGADQRAGAGDDPDRESLTVTLWSWEERQLPLLLHQLRQLFGASCELRAARRPHTAEHLHAALLAQLEFVERRIGGTRSGGAERRTLRLGDIHLPLAEYAPWRRQLTELEEATAACALDLVEPDHALR